MDALLLSGASFCVRKQMKKGKKYGRLAAIKFVKKDKWGGLHWLFKCTCGNEKVIRAYDVKSEVVRSCGCLNVERTRRAHITHGKTHTVEYCAWQHIKDRCSNIKNMRYKDYGKRNITVCRRWQKFEKFYEDMGRRPSSKHSVDRIDNNGDYEPSNCRWATQREQADNKRNTIFVSVNGVQIPFTELAEMLNIKVITLYCRLFVRGWSLRRALTTKVK